MRGRQVAVRYLDYGAEFFAEQLRQHIPRGSRELQSCPEPARKHHLADCCQQTAIRAIMIGEDQVFACQLLNRIKKVTEARWTIKIGRHSSRPLENLSQA